MSTNLEDVRRVLQQQLQNVHVEMNVSLAQNVASTENINVMGGHDSARQARFGAALNRHLLDRLQTGSRLDCRTVSMGINASAWSKTATIEYEPDLLFIDKAIDADNLLAAVTMIEIVWKNRPFLEAPAPIDPGPFFGKLQSYAMVDFMKPRLVLFRKGNDWKPETFGADAMPRRLPGWDFEADWNAVYAQASDEASRERVRNEFLRALPQSAPVHPVQPVRIAPKRTGFLEWLLRPFRS